MPQGSSEIFYVREQSPYPYPNSHVFPTHSQCLWPKCSLVMVASPRVLISEPPVRTRSSWAADCLSVTADAE